MINFDVRIVSKDIINGEPIATCVVLTHDNQYFTTVRFNYFVKSCQMIDFSDAETESVLCIKEITYKHYNMLIQSIYNAVSAAISKEIISKQFR